MSNFNLSSEKAVISPLAVIVPVLDIFLKPLMSLLLSTITAFDADTVPAVIPSICSNSDSAITALPIVKPVAVTTPETVVPADVVSIFLVAH